jgi:hypothetical protein
VLPRLPRTSVVQTAEEHPDARAWLVWARFPLVRVRALEEGAGWEVTFRDVRYMDRAGAGGLAGPTVQVEAALDRGDGGGS